MENMHNLGFGLSAFKELDIQSKLGIKGIDRITKNALMVHKYGLKYNRICNGIIPKKVESLAFSNIQSFYNDSRAMYFERFRTLTQSCLKDPFGLTKVLEINSSMRAWQSCMKLMSDDFLNNYNNMVLATTKSLSSEIVKMNLNMSELSSIKLFNINDLIPELTDIYKIEFDEDLENEVNLQEVKDIVNARIEDAKSTVTKQNIDIISLINNIIRLIKESNAKGGLLNNVVSGVLVDIIILILIFIYNSNPYTPTNADVNYIVKSTKQIVKTMEVDTNFYNEIRIVIKDELEVRRSNKMKSSVKYYLSFGDLVKIEHKNKNWTKISYTNQFTDEREIGWVLTRYIKRLD